MIDNVNIDIHFWHWRDTCVELDESVGILCHIFCLWQKTLILNYKPFCPYFLFLKMCVYCEFFYSQTFFICVSKIQCNPLAYKQMSYFLSVWISCVNCEDCVKNPVYHLKPAHFLLLSSHDCSCTSPSYSLLSGFWHVFGVFRHWPHDSILGS